MFADVEGILMEEEGSAIVLESGSVDEVVLECPYTLEETDPAKELVIKWKHNKVETPIYQWIPYREPRVS